MQSELNESKTEVLVGFRTLPYLVPISQIPSPSNLARFDDSSSLTLFFMDLEANHLPLPTIVALDLPLYPYLMNFQVLEVSWYIKLLFFLSAVTAGLLRNLAWLDYNN